VVRSNLSRGKRPTISPLLLQFTSLLPPNAFRCFVAHATELETRRRGLPAASRLLYRLVMAGVAGKPTTCSGSRAAHIIRLTTLGVLKRSNGMTRLWNVGGNILSASHPSLYLLTQNFSIGGRRQPDIVLTQLSPAIVFNYAKFHSYSGMAPHNMAEQNTA